MANEVLEKMRKRLRKEKPARQRLKLKDERFLLLRRLHDLSPESAHKLHDWFRAYPVLGQERVLDFV